MTQTSLSARFADSQIVVFQSNQYSANQSNPLPFNFTSKYTPFCNGRSLEPEFSNPLSLEVPPYTTKQVPPVGDSSYHDCNSFDASLCPKAGSDILVRGSACIHYTENICRMYLHPTMHQGVPWDTSKSDHP